MAELRVWELDTPEHYKSLRSKEAKKDVDILLPDKSGELVVDTTLFKVLAKSGNITGYQILKPDIKESPLRGDVKDFKGPIYAPPYRTNDTFIGVHETTEWVCATDKDYNDVIDRTIDNEFKTEWFPDSDLFGSKMYVKLRFISGVIASPWSDSYEFIYTQNGLRRPVVTVKEEALTPTLRCSELKVFGSIVKPNHIATTWVIKELDTSKIVWSLNKDTRNLREVKVPVDILKVDTKYKIICIQHTDSNQRYLSNTTKGITYYSTPVAAIETPTLTFDKDKMNIKCTPFKVLNGTDIHVYTHWTILNKTGAVVYEDNKSTSLTSLSLYGITLPDNEYTIKCRYIGKTTLSNISFINITTPAIKFANNNLRLNIKELDNGDVKLVFEKPDIITGEEYLYLTYTIRSTLNGKILDIFMDNDIEKHTGKEISYTIPGKIWIDWFGRPISKTGKTPNTGLNNETGTIDSSTEKIEDVPSIAVIGRIVTSTRVFDYESTVLRHNYDFTLGTIGVINSNDLSPKFTLPTYESKYKWMLDYCNEKYKKDINSFINYRLIKTKDNTDVTSKVKITNNGVVECDGLENNAEYLLTLMYLTPFRKHIVEHKFRTVEYNMAKPILRLLGTGLQKIIEATGYNLSNYSGLGADHATTTWTLYGPTGDVITQERNSNKLTRWYLDSNVVNFVFNTEYTVGCIFTSTSGISSAETKLKFTIKPYVVTIDGLHVKNQVNQKVPLNSASFGYQTFVAKYEGSNDIVNNETEKESTWIIKTVSGTIINTTKKLSDFKNYTIPNNINLDPNKLYNVEVTVLSSSGFNSNKLNTTIATIDPTIDNRSKIDVNITGEEAERVLKFKVNDGPLYTPLRKIVVTWTNKSSSIDVNTNTGDFEIPWGYGRLTDDMTIDLIYVDVLNNQFKKYVKLYLESSASLGDNARYGLEDMVDNTTNTKTLTTLNPTDKPTFIDEINYGKPKVNLYVRDGKIKVITSHPDKRYSTKLDVVIKNSNNEVIGTSDSWDAEINLPEVPNVSYYATASILFNTNKRSETGVSERVLTTYVEQTNAVPDFSLVKDVHVEGLDKNNISLRYKLEYPAAITPKIEFTPYVLLSHVQVELRDTNSNSVVYSKRYNADVKQDEYLELKLREKAHNKYDYIGNPSYDYSVVVEETIGRNDGILISKTYKLSAWYVYKDGTVSDKVSLGVDTHNLELRVPKENEDYTVVVTNGIMDRWNKDKNTLNSFTITKKNNIYTLEEINNYLKETNNLLKNTVLNQSVSKLRKQEQEGEDTYSYSYTLLKDITYSPLKYVDSLDVKCVNSILDIKFNTDDYNKLVDPNSEYTTDDTWIKTSIIVEIDNKPYIMRSLTHEELLAESRKYFGSAYSGKPGNVEIKLSMELDKVIKLKEEISGCNIKVIRHAKNAEYDSITGYRLSKYDIGIKVTVSYDPNGGTGTMPSVTVDAGTVVRLANNEFNAKDPNRQEFKIWDIDGKEYVPGAEITTSYKDIVVKAMWKDKPISPSITPGSDPFDKYPPINGRNYAVIHFDLNGGTIINSQNIFIDRKVLKRGNYKVLSPGLDLNTYKNAILPPEGKRFKGLSADGKSITNESPFIENVIKDTIVVVEYE